MLKLGTIVKDTTTGQSGMLTLMQLEQNGNVYYAFQPTGLNPKTGEPVFTRWIVDSVIENGVEIIPPYLPEKILGTDATDMASGYSGKVVSLRLHINGCVHVSLQSSTILSETGDVPLSVDFDIRRLVGDAIPKLTEDEKEISQLNTPSPVAVKPYSPRI